VLRVRSTPGRLKAIVRAPVLILATGAFATLVASCKDSTGPRPAVTVTVASLAGPSYSADSAGQQLIQCDVTLQARNPGSQGATWMTATFAFYAPDGSTSAFAVDTVPAETVGSSWGAPSIGPGATQTARWSVEGSIPFVLKIRFSYQMGGGAADASVVSVTCEPSARPGPPPTITMLQYQPYTSLQPGDTLHLSYAATSPVGLWETLIHLTGACDTTLRVPEQVKLAVAHDVALVMPAACRLGVPISVTAASYDVRLQETSRSLTLPALVDHRSPVLSANVSTPYSAWAQAASFLGYLFTGDAIEVNVTATDNHALHRIYWEVRPVGLRDSLLVSGPDAFRTITIPSRASWTGPIRLVLYAKDESGNVSDTIATAAGAIEVAPNVGPTPTLASIPGDITDVAFDAKRNVIYLLQSNSYKIAVFSPATLTVVRTIALPDNAPAFDLSPSGDSIITVLMNSKAIGVVDLTQASPALTTVPLTDLASTYRLLNVRVASTGRVLFVAQHTAVDSASKRLYSYDLAGGVLRLRLDTPDLGYESSGPLERSTDGTVVVVNGEAGAFLRYDAATDRFEPAQTARVQDTRPSVDATGAHIAVSGDLYDRSLQYLLTVRAAMSGEGPAAISSDGQTHYLAIAPTYTQLGIVRSRVSDGSIVDHIPAPLLITMLRVSPDGSTLVVVESYNFGPARIGLVNLLQLH